MASCFGSPGKLIQDLLSIALVLKIKKKGYFGRRRVGHCEGHEKIARCLHRTKGRWLLVLRIRSIRPPKSFNFIVFSPFSLLPLYSMLPLFLTWIISAAFQLVGRVLLLLPSSPVLQQQTIVKAQI